MELKVRSLDVIEPKSVQEVETQLLDKHEESLNNVQDDVQISENNVHDIVQNSDLELKEEDVLSYIGKRYNKQINSFDELMAERKENEQLLQEEREYRIRAAKRRLDEDKKTKESILKVYEYNQANKNVDDFNSNSYYYNTEKNNTF